MLSLVELLHSKQKKHSQTSSEDIQLELQIQRDIQDVFADLFEEDDLELTQVRPPMVALPPCPALGADPCLSNHSART